MNIAVNIVCRVSQQLQMKDLWHRFWAINLCRGKTFLPPLRLTPTLIHPLQLFCSASTAPIISSLSIRLPLLFYLPRITLVLHYLCLFFFQLIFCADLTTALQSRRGKLYILHPKAWSSHGRTHFCHGRHHKHSHLWSANGLSTTCETHTYTRTHTKCITVCEY